MVYVIVTSSIYGIEMRLNDGGILVNFNVSIIASNIVLMYVRHYANDILDLVHADMRVRASEFLFIFPEIVFEHIEHILQGVRPRLIAPHDQLLECLKIKKQVLTSSGKWGAVMRQHPFYKGAAASTAQPPPL